MNVYAYSFLDMTEGKMVSGLMAAICKESVLASIEGCGYHAMAVTVRAMPELKGAIEMDCLGCYSLNPERVQQLSRELLLRRGGGDL